jgi:hypothetical protein
MQSPDSQDLPKTEPEPATVQPSIRGSTSTAIPDTQDEQHYPHPLPPTEPMNEDTLSPQPADSIAIQTEGPTEQAFVGEQVRYHKAVARHESGSQRLGPRSTRRSILGSAEARTREPARDRAPYSTRQ